MQCGDSARPHLQEPDQGRGRAAPSHGGGAGQCRSASDINSAIREWCKRLSTWIATNGEHFENALQTRLLCFVL